MFFVTDGVEDQNVNGSRVQSLMDPSYRTTIKNPRHLHRGAIHGISVVADQRLANSHMAPFQPNVGSTLKSCASPGLYFKVTTDQDISGAMSALFNLAVATARLAIVGASPRATTNSQFLPPTRSSMPSIGSSCESRP